MNKKLVSIIIPFFNRVNQVEKALKSAINQTYNNKEIILVNDGSTDSIEIIEEIVGVQTLLELQEVAMELHVQKIHLEY